MTREDKRINTKKIAERRVRRDHADKILEFVATNKIKPVLKQLDTALTGLGGDFQRRKYWRAVLPMERIK